MRPFKYTRSDTESPFQMNFDHLTCLYDNYQLKKKKECHRSSDKKMNMGKKPLCLREREVRDWMTEYRHSAMEKRSQKFTSEARDSMTEGRRSATENNETSPDYPMTKQCEKIAMTKEPPRK